MESIGRYHGTMWDCCNSDGSIILHQDLTKSSTNIHRHPTGISFRPPNAVSDDDNNGDDGDDDDDDNSNNVNVSSLLCVEFGGHGCLIDGQEDDTSTSSLQTKSPFFFCLMLVTVMKELI